MGICGSKDQPDPAPKPAQQKAAEAPAKTEPAAPAASATARAADVPAVPAAAEPAPAEAKPAAGDAPDKKEDPAPVEAAAAEVAKPAAEVTAEPVDALAAAAPSTEAEAPKPKKVKVFLIYYSTYGHILKLAQAYKAALETVEGLEVELYQVAETLRAEELEKMQAPPKPSDIPTADPSKLDQADAIVFGFPTRFGMMAAQMKAFFDATGGLWQAGALYGKPVSIFTSTALQGGGQETTIMTAVTQLAHHGMIFVPTGYAAGGAMFGVAEAKGGSPWGAGTLAGLDGSRQPSDGELEALAVQAKHFANIAKKLTA